MKINEIADTSMPSVFCYDILIEKIPMKDDQELSISDIQVKMDQSTVTVKSVQIHDGHLSIGLGVILVAEDIRHVTRSTRSAMINVSGRQHPSRTGNPSLASDVVEVRDLNVIHHTQEELLRPVMGDA